ncbi:MAG TPA: DUF2723 domain-containing protein [Gemmatimonadales bacterium]|nr:DUF2723 domain-containing protein [Gemmatimonadales bacterium]
MNDTIARRPPFLAAVAVFLVVLTGYVLTLAPTVTFWDAGEFIAVARILGIPHPPGTPLFVLIAHVWGSLVPFGEFAWRTNLLSAVLSAGAAGFFFLVAHESLRAAAAGLEEASARLVSLGGAAAAAIIGAFTFTNWQNSNETEVYGIATFTIAAICWLCHVWRARRGTPGASKLLLLIVYLGGISMGNHLLALLVGPAVVMFLWATLRSDPAADPARRRVEWAELAVVAGVWALLIGTGLGSSTLTFLGLACFLAAATFAAMSGAGTFAAATLFIAAIGMTPYLYLFLRAAQDPVINEADPSTWEALLAVIRRAQYPPRTPFDDPTELSGPGNPGRSLTLIGLQLQNYILYFHWQWGRILSSQWIGSIVTVVFFSLGFHGAWMQRRSDRAAWWLLFTLFLVTGLGLVAYMNFKPGFSQGYARYPDFEDHEVRERDYFFVVSFVVWGVWAGMGLAGLARRALAALRPVPRPAAGLVFLGALIPVALNWTAASRRHGPDATLAADFAYDLLNTAPPYGVLFTYGDNDTFPLWWAQEVEGIRQDVTIVCLALANTDWYIRQLRDNPLRDLDPAQLPAIWRDSVIAKPTWPVHTLTDEQIAATFTQGAMQQLWEQGASVDFAGFTRTYRPGEIGQPRDVVAIRVLQQNLGRRPIVWSVTAGRSFGGLGDRALQRGLGYALLPAPPDTAQPHIVGSVLGALPVDVAATDQLSWNTYRYARLFEAEELRLDATSEGMARSLAYPFTVLTFAYEALGDRARMLRNLERAAKLNPDPQLGAILDQLRLEALQGMPDSPPPGAVPDSTGR